MRTFRRAVAPGLLAGALLFFTGARYMSGETPPAADFFSSPVMREFDGVRYDARGLQYRLQAEQVTVGEHPRTQILQRPRFSARQADGGRWEARALWAELRGEILQLHEQVYARRLFPASAALEIYGDHMQWRGEGSPLSLAGAPARFRRQSQPPVQGSAERLYFDAQDGRLRLEGSAVLERADGVLRSESLEYFVRSENAP